MLLNFTVSNFLSFNHATSFSLLPGKISKQHSDHVISGKIFDSLKGAAVYGANASGKTNLIDALMALQVCVLSETTKHILNNNFKLSNEFDATEFEIDFEENDFTYKYFLKTNGNEVLLEKLSLIQKYGELKPIFERNKLQITLGTELQKSSDWYMNRTFQAHTTFFFKLIQDGIIERSAGIFGANHIFNMFLFFRDLLFVKPNTTFNPVSFGYYLRQNEFQSYLKQLLKIADLGISDIRWVPMSQEETEKNYNQAQMGQKNPIPPEGTLFSKDDLGNMTMIDLHQGQKHGFALRTIHNNIEFQIQQESAGTRRLLDFSLAFFLLKTRGGCLFIDELDCRLHLFLSQFLINDHMNKSNSKGQLIITLHDLNLMTNELWRSDEIWFTEKRVDGSTDMYSLYQFKPRFDKDLQKGYVQGKYGAIPMIGEFTDE